MSSIPDVQAPSEAGTPTWTDLFNAVPSPRSLVEHLDLHVIGQRAAKQKLAVAVSNHFKRLVDRERSHRVTGRHPLANDPDLMHVYIEPSNVLLIGPSGTGKSLLVKALAKKLTVPVIHADATTFTEVGYGGADVQSLLTRLLLAAEGDFGKAQSGIIFIDQIDRIARRPNLGRDITGEAVQHAILNVIDGFVLFIPTTLGPTHPAEIEPFDTTDLLFIFAGGFAGLDEIIARRLRRGPDGFGFGTVPNDCQKGNLLHYVLPCDLEEFGLIPEFLGRLPVIATLDDLGVDHLARILGDPENAILKQFRKLLRLQGADLEFTDGAIKEIARLAHERKVGARGLRAVVEQIVEGVMFEVSEADRGTCFVIDERVVKGESEVGRRVMR
jgi:ATP-dependent Clp protease ATP-binding subunit ClpX